MRFRLMTTDKMGNKVGGHSQGKVVNGKFSEHYERGQVLESDRPLDTLFRGKFERLDGPMPEPDSEPSRAKGRGRR